MEPWLLGIAAAANTLTALAYFGIAYYVAPHFRLPKVSGKRVQLARAFALMFSVFAGLVHIELVVSAFQGEYGSWFISWRGMANHILQAIAICGFLAISRDSLTMKAFEREFYENVLDDYLQEMEAVRIEKSAVSYVNHKVWTDRMDQAIRNGAISTVFQPIINVNSGNAVGYEALSRFPDYPDATTERWFFIAAQMGRAIELEVAAIRSALSYEHLLPPGCYMTLNVSQDSFASLELIEAFSEVDNLHRFVLEITEQAPIVRYKPLRDAVALVRHMGLRIAVDDMGSGFASMRRVVELHPEIIKIDRSLTRWLASSEYEQAFVKSIKQYASTVGALVVVEGIETKEQVTMLRRMGLRFAQGWYYGRPGELPES